MKATDNEGSAILTVQPVHKTSKKRPVRGQREAESKQIGDWVDGKTQEKYMPLENVKVLLLGQSKSGKSTLINNVRKQYSWASWKAERNSWRAVIQLNLIRSIITIIETLQAEADNLPIAHLSTQIPPGGYHHSNKTIPKRPLGSAAVNTRLPALLTDKHRLLELRLSPLRSVEEDLNRMLDKVTQGLIDGGGYVLGQTLHTQQVKVREMESIPEGTPFTCTGYESANHCGSGSGSPTSAVNEITEVILSCRDDMKALWEDRVVQAVLGKRQIRLERSAGFFLNDIDRIAVRDYEPSEDDIARVQLRTSGHQEYRIEFDQGFQGSYGPEWIIYEVSGLQQLRHPYISFFEAINAIIFLAPISGFDERLPEDPKVNRLEDTYLLWKAVCSSRLLAHTCMITVFNKCDVLEEKLRKGAQVKNTVPSYGERPNESSEVIAYFMKQFKNILRQESLVSRRSHFYATSVTDPKAAHVALEAIRDNILREQLEIANFL